MTPREDLVSSAVTFLQDPSVASASLDKRIEFLKSKNLTQEEIDLSLARAEQGPPSLSSQQNAPYYPPPQQYRGPPSNRYPYPYNPYGEWQPPPPEPPGRDWRDWFIMATVVGGASYGLYALAQRYVKPLIAPPTPPQLEQDKMAIDDQFNRAFALIDTLTSDTAALKEAEQARTQRLDAAITDIETIVSDLRAANVRREDDARRMETEIRNMKDSLPRSIDSVREVSEKQLKELSAELGSLKLLMGNRMGGSSSFGSSAPAIPRTQSGSVPSTHGSTVPTTTEPAPGSSSNVTGISGTGKVPSFATPSSSYSSQNPISASSTTPRPASSIPFGSSSGKAAIPSWQMAAQNRAKSEFSPASPQTGSTEIGMPPVDGADAIAAMQEA